MTKEGKFKLRKRVELDAEKHLECQFLTLYFEL